MATGDPETAHALIFLVILATTADALWRGWWDTAAWLILFNLLLNAYPVPSMRYIRGGMARLAQSRRER